MTENFIWHRASKSLNPPLPCSRDVMQSRTNGWKSRRRFARGTYGDVTIQTPGDTCAYQDGCNRHGGGARTRDLTCPREAIRSMIFGRSVNRLRGKTAVVKTKKNTSAERDRTVPTLWRLTRRSALMMPRRTTKCERKHKDLFREHSNILFFCAPRTRSSNRSVLKRGSNANIDAKNEMWMPVPQLSYAVLGREQFF